MTIIEDKRAHADILQAAMDETYGMGVCTLDRLITRNEERYPNELEISRLFENNSRGLAFRLYLYSMPMRRELATRIEKTLKELSDLPIPVKTSEEKFTIGDIREIDWGIFSRVLPDAFEELLMIKFLFTPDGNHKDSNSK